MRHLLAAAVLTLALAACNGDQKAAENLDAAKAYLADNATKPGIRTLPSGVQYEVVHEGPKDGVSPGPRDLVKVNYEARLTDGEVIDSSYERGVPAVMHLDQLIPAWTEALQKMKPGDEWTLYVPPEQGYGEKGKGPVPPNSVLVFRIELIAITS